MTQIMCRAGCSTSIPGSNFTPHFGNHNRREAAADKIYHMIPSLFTFYCLLSQLAVRLISPCKMHICVSHIYLFCTHFFICDCWANSHLYTSVSSMICRSYCDRKIAKPCLSGFCAKNCFAVILLSAGKVSWQRKMKQLSNCSKKFIPSENQWLVTSCTSCTFRNTLIWITLGLGNFIHFISSCPPPKGLLMQRLLL